MNQVPFGLTLMQAVLSSLLTAAAVVAAMAAFSRRNVDAFILSAIERQPEVSKAVFRNLFSAEMALIGSVAASVEHLAREMHGFNAAIAEQKELNSKYQQHMLTFPQAVTSLGETLERLDRTLQVLIAGHDSTTQRVSAIEGAMRMHGRGGAR